MVEIIEAKASLAAYSPEDIKTREQNQRTQLSLKTKIKLLLFDGERPIVNIRRDLLQARDKILQRNQEDETRDSEITGIINRWVGTLIKWDIERAVECGEVEEVWELLEQMQERQLNGYITNDEEIQEILAKIGDTICYSPDLISSLLSYEGGASMSS